MIETAIEMIVMEKREKSNIKIKMIVKEGIVDKQKEENVQLKDFNMIGMKEVVVESTTKRIETIKKIKREEIDLKKSNQSATAQDKKEPTDY